MVTPATVFNEASVALADAGEALALYYRMWTGTSARFGADEDRIGAGPDDILALPPEVKRFSVAAQNKAWYLAAVTHRAGHTEFNTFDTGVPSAVATFFQRHAPPSLRDDVVIRTSRDLLEVISSIDHQRSGLYRFVRMLEDYRVDESLKRSYDGLRDMLVAVQQDAARAIVDASPAALPPRTRFGQLVSLMSVSDLAMGPALDPELHEPYRDLARAQRSLATDQATVLDSVYWALRLWAAALRLPNMLRPDGQQRPVRMDHLFPAGNGAYAQGPAWKPGEIPQLEDVPRLEGSDVLAIELTEAEYRDSLTVSIMRHTPAPTPANALLVFERGRDLPVSDDDPDAAEALAGPGREQELPWERPPEPLPHEHPHDEDEPHDPEHGELSRRSPADFLYPEWDTFRHAYRDSWVRVRESVPAAISKTRTASKAEASIRAYGPVCRRLRSQLESIIPAGITRQPGFPWGDDIDLDAAIEAMVNARCGRSASERVYETRVRGRRDVVASLLLDVSCSTAERREPGATASATADTTHLTWTEARSPAVAAKGYRTLLDTEVEMASVIASVVSQIGDGFGLYAFSGTGRADVRFDVLKEIGERWGPAVHRRLDQLRPVHSTRIGAAIRHASRKLARCEATTKILLLLSDGRPYDVDYGPVGVHGHADFDAEYAWGDTARAIEECRRWDISFGAIVTGDEAEVAENISSHAAWVKCGDVEDLPESVTSVFGRLMSRQLI